MYSTNGQGQAAANLALDCGFLADAELLRESCRRNSIGKFCNPANEQLNGFSDNITEVCGSSSVTTCSSECRDQIMLARNTLGCCVNVGHNDSSSPLYNPEPFTYALWSSCNVEPVTEECSPSTIKIGLDQDRSDIWTPSCPTAVYLERLVSISCTRRFLEPVLDMLARAVCSE